MVTKQLIYCAHNIHIEYFLTDTDKYVLFFTWDNPELSASWEGLSENVSI